MNYIRMDDVMKKKTVALIIIIFAALLIAAAVFGVVGYWLPYQKAISTFASEKSITLYQQEDGSVLIQWPEGSNADQYLLEILIPSQNAAPQVEYSTYITGKTSHIIEQLAGNSQRTIRIQTVAQYSFPFGKAPRVRLGENAIEITDTFCAPEIRNIQWIPNPDTDQVSITLDVNADCVTRLYNAASKTLIDTFTGGASTLSFGDGQDFPIPSYGEEYTFAFDVYRQTQQYTYYGLMSESVTLVREDLLGTVLNLAGTGAKNNQYTFTWNETKGDYYLFQYRQNEDQQWETLLQVPADGTRSYTTESLEPYSYRQYRVIAQKLEETEDQEPIAQSEIFPVQTGSALIYSTVWPIQSLTVYSDPQKSETIGTAKEGTAFCVLDEENGLFYVRYQDTFGYIDSNYCLINLSEFLGSLCLYDITNSYESVFKIHEYDIPDVTGEVITGYENIRLSTNNYLVPLLYPTALKLEQAALSAGEQGYSLKIYDAFRPQAATYGLYDQAYDFSQEEIPEEELPEDYTPPETEPDDPEATLPPYTYELYMTDNGRYALNYFLAKGRSRHNQGVAMDMTLVKNGKDLPMQTDIHDLSWYSETKENNTNANTLAKIMKAAGFAGLVSEWWHFQDDENVNALDVPALWNGVSPQCWMADENGWRYRRANGKYYSDCTATIDGKEYRFDANGYVIN